MLVTSRPEQSMLEAIRPGVEDVLIKPLNDNVRQITCSSDFMSRLLKVKNERYE